MTGASGEAQSLANDVVDAAQACVNGVYDLGEEAAGEVVAALLTANKLVGEALEKASAALVGK